MTDKTPKTQELPILPFENQATWEAWLEQNHAASRGVWMQLAKKGAGIPTVTYVEAVEAALCYGWIDGQSRSQDEKTYLQKFTPRSKRSIWSKINVERALKLIEAGRMKPAGLAEIQRAQADGRWEAAYDSPKNSSIPEDLQAALDRSPKAQAFFNTLNSQNRYAILHRLQTAVKPETRQRRLEKFIQMLENNERLHP
jgi:uncharacterized protein YdeI (YjbR/CyaY-like superfamily)